MCFRVGIGTIVSTGICWGPDAVVVQSDPEMSKHSAEIIRQTLQVDTKTYLTSDIFSCILCVVQDASQLQMKTKLCSTDRKFWAILHALIKLIVLSGHSTFWII